MLAFVPLATGSLPLVEEDEAERPLLSAVPNPAPAFASRSIKKKYNEPSWKTW